MHDDLESHLRLMRGASSFRRIINRQDDDGTESWSRRATISLGGIYIYPCCLSIADACTAGVTLLVLNKLMDVVSQLRLVRSEFPFICP
jgi:hypothetical protein